MGHPCNCSCAEECGLSGNENETSACQDQADFADSYGDGCNMYAQIPSWCADAYAWTNTDGIHAGMACCACGGGAGNCLAGSYLENSTCIKCPVNSNSPEGSTSLTACTCNAGSSGPDGGFCSFCAAGKYKSQTGPQPCVRCPRGTYSYAVGAVSESTCVNSRTAVAASSPAAPPPPPPPPSSSSLASWGNHMYKHCALNFTLQQLRKRQKDFLPPKFKTGGLGKLMQPDVFEAWTCVEGHDCSGTSAPHDGWFCWVLDERLAVPYECAPEQWLPWGHNSDLKLV